MRSNFRGRSGESAGNLVGRVEDGIQPGRKASLTVRLGVVLVGVEERDRLPGAERQAAADDRDRQRRRGQHRDQVIGPVARRAVAMDPAIVARQEPVQRRHQVRVGTGAQLHDDEAGRGMRHEDVEQAVALAGHEFLAGPGQVEQAAAPGGLDGQLGASSSPRSAPRDSPAAAVRLREEVAEAAADARQQAARRSRGDSGPRSAASRPLAPQ